MRNMRSFAIGNLAMIAVALGLWTVGARAGEQSSSNDIAALRSGGLKAVAHVRGHYTADFEPEHWQQYDLKLISRNSDLIVQAKPIKQGSSLSSNGRSIESVFQLKADVILKGSSSLLETKLVHVPGGQITFDDGTSAQITNPAELALEKGGAFLFFLKNEPDGLRLVGFGQGLVFMDYTEHSIESFANQTDWIRSDLRGKSPDNVIDLIREYVSSAD